MEASQSSPSTAHPGANPDQFSQDVHTPIRRPSRLLISTLGWELQSILARSPNFRAVKRAHYTSPNAKVDSVINEVEKNGIPLIISGWNRHPQWPRSLFNIDWLRKNGDQNPAVRNVHNRADFKLPLDEFIKKLHESPAYASADEQERLYGKDGECPAQWTEWLTETGVIPDQLLFYRSNDFLKFLPDKAKVQTLMCYMGIGDTFTPFHKDLCASTGHNLMCFSEHSGSAFWFMTESSAAPQVAAYFHQLGKEIDLETHVVTIEELVNAPFSVYIAEQQPGDLVLVPPRSCHQVVNKGGITVKTSWSRMSLHGLQTALWHELPIYHRVCRQEIYKVKATIFHALQHFTRITEDLLGGSMDASCITTGSLKQLLCLFDDILASEFSVSRDSMLHVSSDIFHTDDLHCDFCGADVFQSFFECAHCLPTTSSGTSADFLPVGEGLILCPSCYVEGRICHCGRMQPGQCRPFNDLLRVRDQAVRAIERMEADYINVHGYFLEQPDRLLSVGDANIFEAACKLLQKREMDSKTGKSCRVSRVSHPVPTAVYCRKCHHSACYTHLLEVHSVHSVDAIIRSNRQDGDEDWHQYHRSCLQQYPEIRQRVVEDEERGSRPNALHRLTYLAKTFTTCKAIAVEVTNRGWYDRFPQTTSIPLANTPAKALFTLPDADDDEEPCNNHTPNDSPSISPTTPARNASNLQMIHSRHSPTSPSVARHTLAEGIAEGQLRQVDLSVMPNSRSLIDDPMSPSPQSGTLQVFDSLTGDSTQTQHDTSVDDDLENLSDLTDLPNEFDSSPRNPIKVIPVSETSDQQLSVVVSFPSSSAAVSSSDTLLLNESKLKSRLVFDCVELPRLKWSNGKTESVSLPSRPKRKRTAVLSMPDGSSDSDNMPSTVQVLSKRKKSQGPASRLPPSSRRRHSSPNVQNSPPQNNFLANALNQTFQLNSTSATLRVPSIPPIPSSSSNRVISPTTENKYRHVGVQKNPNFTRHTSDDQPSKDSSDCILRLQAENRELRADVETYKHRCSRYQEGLDELNRRYPRHRPFLAPPPPSSPSASAPYPSPEFANHPRWRLRNPLPEHHAAAREPDLPPIEVLPLRTPSSSEGAPAPLWRTPTEPRGHGMKPRGDAPGGHRHPYGSPQRGRRRGFTEPSNGRRQRGAPQGAFSMDGREPVSDPTPPDSSVIVAPEGSGTSPRINTVVQDHDEAPDRTR